MPIWPSSEVPRWLVKHYFQVSVTVFPEENSIWIGPLSKEDFPHQCGQVIPICWEPKDNKKAEERQIQSFSLLEQGHSSSVLGYQNSQFSGFWRKGLTPTAPFLPVLRPLDSNWITSLAFLVLQLADGRSCDFSASKIMWANFSFYIYGLLLVLFLWRTLMNTKVKHTQPLFQKLLR